ncbi:MAG: DNA polymerase I [Flavobacteriaceae bacterium]|nr:DNA polymerase I [Flavobacteriaceae bacterium]MDO7581979.1 DNA polymerase I [Flavobacteriaceae bacterium]MDO7598969.1 DNA polymerase I [Flavobacteriaceae bacterium]MDO7603980.1 DNA polymerase I [Flavobacteriaceae bacterium]MDO7615628.1 DNA polymerase I [Flavobacteriaceae bacterium]
MSKPKKLFLLDAFALIFRGYYAFIKNPRINSKGMDTSAIFGFMNSLLDVIKREKPDYLAVCFDKGGSVSRKELFEDYKANRNETPEAIKIAVPYIQQILEAMQIPVIEKAGFEADDIIGTLAKQAEKEGFQTFMVTPDKDFAQLVSENIFMYRPARMGNAIEIWGIPEVQARFEIERPEQVIDYLGMMGDSVDNIPGLPGVGDKTAKKFLKEYGSMEVLLENTHQLKGKMKERIEANKELGMLSKELAKIILDVPVTFEADSYKLTDPNIQEVQPLFDELEFRRMQETIQRIFNTSEVVAAPKEKNVANSPTPIANNGQMDLFAPAGAGTISPTEDTIQSKQTLVNTPHAYQCIDTPLAFSLLMEKLMKQKSVCFDTETTSINALQAELVGIAFSWENHKGYYLPFPDDQKDAQKIIEQIRPFFEQEGIEKVGHNLKYDLKVLSNYNLSVKGPLYDTLIAHYLINPDRRHGMDILAASYLNYEPQPITDLIGKKGKNQGNMRDVSLKDQTQYATEDADITWQLKQYFEKELDAADNQKLFQTVELPLVPVLTAMEKEGINLNVSFLNEFAKTLEIDSARLQKEIFEQAGEEFNLASPKQLGLLLFDKLKLVEKPKKTKTGQYSTAEDVLSSLAKKHSIIANILNWRSIQKLLSTYVIALPDEINPKTGRVHTVYNQAVAATGRLSSNAPNLQNIPIRRERGQQVRKAFIPRDENHVLLAADYSQIELRIIAALSKDPSMVAAFQNNEDIHATTAAKVFGVPLEEVTRTQRSNAKTVNFGIIYGVSAFGLSQQTDLSRSESKELIDTYYESYPKLKAYMSSQIDFARDNGYVATVLGRRRYLKDILSQNAIVRGAAERNAVNAPIQGSAADIIKIAMINIHKRLETGDWKAKMLLQVHDELVFDVPRTEVESLSAMVKEEMENAFVMDVPLVVDLGVGENWLEAH